MQPAKSWAKPSLYQTLGRMIPQATQDSSGLPRILGNWQCQDQYHIALVSKALRCLEYSYVYIYAYVRVCMYIYR